MLYKNKCLHRSFFKTFPLLTDGNKRNGKQVRFRLFCSICFETVLERKSCRAYRWPIGTRSIIFCCQRKKETEAGESLKIWRGLSVMHKYKVFWRNGVCFLFDQMLPLYPLDPPALREIRFRSQQRLQSKLNQKSISQHNVYNFDFFLQTYYKSSAKSAGLYK